MTKLIVDKAVLLKLQLQGFIAGHEVDPLWTKLLQECVVADAQNNANDQAQYVDIPPVNGHYKKSLERVDITIAFSSINGYNVASRIRAMMEDEGVTTRFASDYDKPFDVVESEKRVANSTALVVLLTQDCLKEVEVAFPMAAAQYYYKHTSLVILVHDASSCFFPSYEEHPPSLRNLFSEKAVTFLPCYAESGVDQILDKFNSEKDILARVTETEKGIAEGIYKQLIKKYDVPLTLEKLKVFLIGDSGKEMDHHEVDDMLSKLDTNQDGTISVQEFCSGYMLFEKLASRLTALRQTLAPAEHGTQITENIHTRVFLSHKRSTGQGIAGRLYEGLKKDHAVFLDSEAKFKIHNLKQIVQNTDVFVFILSPGILLSPWCLQELQSALDNKKKVVVIRELLYNLPDELPSHWKPYESLLRDNQLIWMAEYNIQCIASLKAEIGPPDKMIELAMKFLIEFSERIRQSGMLKLTRKLKAGCLPAILWLIQTNTSGVVNMCVKETLKKLAQNSAQQDRLEQTINKLHMNHIKQVDATDYEITDKDVFPWHPSLDFSPSGLHQISVKIRKMKITSPKKVRSVLTSNFGPSIAHIHFVKPVPLVVVPETTPATKSLPMDVPPSPSIGLSSPPPASPSESVPPPPPAPPVFAPPPPLPPAFAPPPPPPGPSPSASPFVKPPLLHSSSSSSGLIAPVNPVILPTEFTLLNDIIIKKIIPLFAETETIIIEQATLSNEGVEVILKNCPKLKRLEIHTSTKITDEAVCRVADLCKDITEVTFPDNDSITGLSFTKLVKECTKLMKIHGIPVDLATTSIHFGPIWDTMSTAALEWFADHPWSNLKELIFTDCNVKNNFHIVMKNRQELESLVLAGAQNVTQKTVDTIITYCDNLRNLNIGANWLTNSSLVSIGQKLKSLKSFIFCSQDVVDEGVAILCSGCPNMEELDLSNCWKITDTSLANIATCKQLAKLTLGGCFKITDAGLQRLAEAKLPLTYLDITDCALITTEGIAPVLQTCSITYLNISGCALLRSLGPENKGTITHLDASRCPLFKDGSSVCKNLNLVYMDLSDGRMKASQIVTIARTAADTIRTLILARNYLFGDNEMFQVTRRAMRLTKLDLTGCPIKNDSILYVGMYCRAMQSLILQDCTQLTHSAFQPLTPCINITEINLAGFASDDITLKTIAKTLPRITKLNLAGGFLSDDSIKVLSENLMKLELLNLSGSEFTDAALGYIGNLSTLKSLNLSNCKRITDNGLYQVTLGCYNLEELFLENCTKLGDKALSSIARNCYHLKKLSTAGCRHLSDDAFKAFESFGEQLEELNLTDCIGITDAVVFVVAPSWVNLKTLHLDDCEQLTDKAITVIGDYCRKLEKLFLENCKFLTDKALQSIAKYNTNIQLLALNGCVKISYRGIQYIAEKNKGIESLYLGGCSQTSDRTLDWISKKCPNIKTLILKSCTEITDSGLKLLSAGCKQLVHIDLSRCPLITDDGIDILTTANSNLQHIVVNECTKLTNTCCIKSFSKCRFLQVLHLDRTKINDIGVKALGLGQCTMLDIISVDGCDVQGKTLHDLTLHLPLIRVFANN